MGLGGEKVEGRVNSFVLTGTELGRAQRLPWYQCGGAPLV